MSLHDMQQLSNKYPSMPVHLEKSSNTKDSRIEKFVFFKPVKKLRVILE